MKHFIDRRKFLSGTAGLVAGSGGAQLFSTTAAAATRPNEDARILDGLEKANADRGRRILIKGGIVVSMDKAVGNLAQGDVLIEGTKIKEIAPDLSAAARDGKAITLAARGKNLPQHVTWILAEASSLYGHGTQDGSGEAAGPLGGGE
jgi:hypothetical protein